MPIKINYERDQWISGTCEGFRFHVKSHDLPSKHGIDNGKISKLELWDDGYNCVNFSREWDICPENDLEQNVVQQLIDRFN